MGQGMTRQPNILFIFFTDQQRADTMACYDQGELYDLVGDPTESTNLFDDPTHRGRVRDMASRIRDWQRATGDTAPLPEL